MERKKVELVKVDVNGELVDAKECTKCGITKTLNKYSVKSNGLGKRKSHCKDCDKEYFDARKEIKAQYDKEYREQNLEKLLKRSRDWHTENREKANERRKEHYYNNHEDELAKRRVYHHQNKHERNEQKKEYYKKNKEKFIQYRINNKEHIQMYNKMKYQREKENFALRWKKYYEDNKEWLLEKDKENYHNNKEKYSERWKIYASSERGQEVIAQKEHRRREREKASIATLTTRQWENCKQHFNHSCAYCLSEEKLTKDHFVPVIKGGELTVRNIVPVCNSCNCSKKDKDFFSWYPTQSFYSEKQMDKILSYLHIQDNEQQIIFF